MQTLEVAINLSQIKDRERSEFHEALRRGNAVKLLTGKLVDRDNRCFYFRVDDYRDVERLLRGFYQVDGLVNIKKIMNPIPSSSMRHDLYVLELAIDIQKGSKRLNNVFVENYPNPAKYMSHHDYFRDVRSSGIAPLMNDRFAIGGVDPINSLGLSSIRMIKDEFEKTQRLSGIPNKPLSKVIDKIIYNKRKTLLLM